jgi:hypothetical protein
LNGWDGLKLAQIYQKEKRRHKDLPTVAPVFTGT